ncbi:MAG: uracil-DNA glycosylase family protein [Allopontixanthobacter sediminis]
MTAPKSRTLIEEFAAAQAWWTDAGVDQDFDDVATDWLAPPEPAGGAGPADPSAPPPTGSQRNSSPAANAVPEPAEVPRLGGEKAAWPTDLDTFRSWWLTEPSLDAGGSFPRIAPRGPAGAKLMIIVAEPEEQDSQDLLSGPLGSFLGNMLAAMGISADEVYFAAVLPRHLPMPDWQQLHAVGIGELLHHHIALAAPDKICALGRNIWPFLGHDLAQGPAFLPNFNHEGRSVPTLGAEGLAELLRSPPRRKRFWQRWLDWTA